MLFRSEAGRQKRVLSEPIEQRLEHAAALLQSQGKAISVHALREVAHVGKRNAQAYLHGHKQSMMAEP